MKRLFTLIALLCLTAGLFTACNKDESSSTPSGTSTNAPTAPAMPSTNK